MPFAIREMYDTMTESEQREVNNFVLFVISRRGAFTAMPNSGQAYDFSDLAGRLSWRGDAVSMQRTLRDEW